MPHWLKKPINQGTQAYFSALWFSFSLARSWLHRSNYHDESVMRMAALVAVDGLIPLGSDFIKKVQSILGQIRPEEVELPRKQGIS